MTPTLFRKRPLVVEAHHFIDPEDQDLAQWCHGHLTWWEDPDGPAGAQIEIPTREGIMTALLGDWIVKGTAGEFYPVKAHIFEAIYEPLVGVHRP